MLSLKTEWDVAELLLLEGWLPEEINGILVFPLPRAAFYHMGHQNFSDAEAAVATPTAIYRARQLLESAGWLERELDSLLKPYLYGGDVWANQTIHHREPVAESPDVASPGSWLASYRRTMAFKRLGSLALVMTSVVTAVVCVG